MPRVLEITCIAKEDRASLFERIQRVGGVIGGERWNMSVEEVIDHISRDEIRFFVTMGEKPVWVVAAISRNGNAYIKTQADGEEPNNLLSLPECA